MYLCAKRFPTTWEKKTLCLPSAVFLAQVLVGPSKQLKQIIQIEHNFVKNPNWPEANSVGNRGFELGATEKQIQVVIRAGLEPGTAGLRVRNAAHSATLPPYETNKPAAFGWSSEDRLLARSSHMAHKLHGGTCRSGWTGTSCFLLKIPLCN